MIGVVRSQRPKVLQVSLEYLPAITHACAVKVSSDRESIQEIGLDEVLALWLPASS